MGNVVAIKKYQEKKKKNVGVGVSRTKSLLKKSTVKFTKKNANSSKKRLRLSLKILMNNIPIAEGLYRDTPSQGAAYSLSNLLQEMRDIDEKLESQINWEDVSKKLYDRITPIIENITLELGRTIRKEIKKLELNKSNKKKAQACFNIIYRKYAKIVEEKSEILNKDIEKFLLKIGG